MERINCLEEDSSFKQTFCNGQVTIDSPPSSTLCQPFNLDHVFSLLKTPYHLQEEVRKSLAKVSNASSGRLASQPISPPCGCRINKINESQSTVCEGDSDMQSGGKQGCQLFYRESHFTPAVYLKENEDECGKRTTRYRKASLEAKQKNSSLPLITASPVQEFGEEEKSTKQSNHRRMCRKDYICERCHKNFSSRKSLDSHIRRKCAESKISSCKKQTKQWSCPKCPERLFTRKRDQTEHIRTSHRFANRPLCDLCKKEFTHNTALKIHQRTHTGEKPYACPVCSRSFAEKRTMEDHKRRHTGERPFLCTVCGKNFTYRQGLYRHMKFHNGVRPFQCSVCGKAFVTRQDLKSHKNSRKHFADSISNDVPTNGPESL